MSKQFLSTLKSTLKSRLWLLPLGVCLGGFLGGIDLMAKGGAHPVIVVLTFGFGIGVLLMPALPTKRDLLGHWKLAIETIDARWTYKKITREEAERLLTEASSYAHHRNVVWWPLWWLSERAKLRRLIARNVRREP